MHKSFLFLSAILFALPACTADDDTSDTSAEVTGNAVHRDAATNHDGSTRDPAQPEPQTMNVTVRIEGTGTIPEVDPQCALDPAGEFHAVYAGDAALSDDGGYVSVMSASSGSITTPSGCEIPDLTVGVITDIVVRAELEATTQNCETHCAASARADAEAACEGDSNAATCRAEAEAEMQAECVTECTEERTVIVAETSLTASALGELDADALYAAALGEIRADFTFDRME